MIRRSQKLLFVAIQLQIRQINNRHDEWKGGGRGGEEWGWCGMGEEWVGEW